jgi:hypothetical protein
MNTETNASPIKLPFDSTVITSHCMGVQSWNGKSVDMVPEYAAAGHEPAVSLACSAAGAGGSASEVGHNIDIYLAVNNSAPNPAAQMAASHGESLSGAGMSQGHTVETHQSQVVLDVTPGQGQGLHT